MTFEQALYLAQQNGMMIQPHPNELSMQFPVQGNLGPFERFLKAYEKAIIAENAPVKKPRVSRTKKSD